MTKLKKGNIVLINHLENWWDIGVINKISRGKYSGDYSYYLLDRKSDIYKKDGHSFNKHSRNGNYFACKEHIVRVLE